MLSFTVKISEWLHGEGSKASYLFRSTDHKMCCLGFLALALGYEKHLLQEVEDPATLVNLTDKNLWPSNLVENGMSLSCGVVNSMALINIMSINDEFHTLEDKIQALKNKFAQLNIDAHFVQ